MLIDMKRRLPISKAPMAGLRESQKQKTREALLAAARRVLKRRGFAKTTTREVAEEAGVAAGTFFVHFPDVDALVEALLDDHLAAALEEAIGSLRGRIDLVGRLLHVSKALFDSYDAEPELAREYIAASLFRSRAGGPTEARLRQFQEWVTEQIAQEAGAVRIDPLHAFSTFFWLYFGALVAGLRGQMNRKEQLALLEVALRRLFNMEKTA
jgi:AcrR family transcriptional regulator